jgi:hypothetical protein
MDKEGLVLRWAVAGPIALATGVCLKMEEGTPGDQRQKLAAGLGLGLAVETLRSMVDAFELDSPRPSPIP